MIRPEPFKAAVVQTLAVLGDLDANLELVKRYVVEASGQGARLIVFPECMNSGYLFDDADHCRTTAEPIDGRYVTTLRELSVEHDAYIVSGMTELGDDSLIYNSSVMTSPEGELIGHYQKQFLATHDQNWFQVGTRGCPVVETELGRIGMLICFDGRIPEIARLLTLAGADVIVDVANFFELDQADQWLPARAYENGVWFVASTKSGVERSIYYPGSSQIVDPAGVVQAIVPQDTHGIAYATVDPAAARSKAWLDGGDRQTDRRPDRYEILRAPFEDTPVATHLREPLVPESVTVKAAAVQSHSLGTPDSLDDALEMVEHAARLGVNLIVLPLAFAVGQASPTADEVGQVEGEQSRARAHIASLCRGYGTVAVLPEVQVSDSGVHHVATVIGTDGELLGKYVQVHPEPHATADPAAEFGMIDTPYGRLGVILGYDGMFPESSRVLALLGVDIIAWPCAWDDPRQRQFLTVTKAEDNRCFLVAANRTDTGFGGGSIVLGPEGLPHWDVEKVLPSETRHGAVITGFLTLALSRQKSMIPKVDVLRNRLVQTYAPLAKAG